METEGTSRIGTAMATLEEGIKGLTQDGEWQRFLRFQAALHEYSFSNTLLIAAQQPNASRVAGFNTWKKLGRSVRKGEKAIWILAPGFPKKKDADEDDAAAERRPVYFRAVPVFDVSQTDGEALPEPVKKLTGNSTGDLFDRLVAFSTGNGCPVTIGDIEGTANGYYEPDKHCIRIRAGLALDQQVKTACHEVAHSTLHRDIEVYRAHRGDCELEAESVAFVVLNHFGIDAGGYSFAYVAGWAGGGDEAVKALKTCAGRIQATARKIIDGIMENIGEANMAAA